MSSAEPHPVPDPGVGAGGWHEPGPIRALHRPGRDAPPGRPGGLLDGLQRLAAGRGRLAERRARCRAHPRAEHRPPPLGRRSDVDQRLGQEELPGRGVLHRPGGDVGQRLAPDHVPAAVPRQRRGRHLPPLRRRSRRRVQRHQGRGLPTGHAGRGRWRQSAGRARDRDPRRYHHADRGHPVRREDGPDGPPRRRGGLPGHGERERQLGPLGHDRRDGRWLHHRRRRERVPERRLHDRRPHREAGLQQLGIPYQAERKETLQD